ncbi:MAG: valine--tRNA ligase, partial [Candidatus Liptonbacteria bacterium]|nr:valine--tRNA ligase [Candidatus Liptonbacteria bacterium]
MQELGKRFDFEQEEERIYRTWEESGYFAPEQCVKDGVCAPDAEPFSIVLPPPNVTGTLHMGHAAMLVLEDIMIRFNRMRGKRTLWVPGTDHAAIATQSKVEKILYEEEKKTRFDLGREEFLRRVNAFAQESHDTIVNQVRRMGASVDWGREAFTLDEQRSRAVRTAFKRMYDGGLIYRGARIVNWDPKLQTTVSDDEIEWVEEKAKFYYLKYGPFTIGTARPETKFGDKYVVMHPDDARYAAYAHGQTLEVEWINGPVTATVIKDTAVNPAFGTGVMTITPWHSLIDFEIAERHGLDKEQIIDPTGKLLPIAGEFAGTHIKKARPLIAEKLEKKGLLVKTDESYVHNVAINSRGGGIIEPQIKEQWFVDVKSLKPTMRGVVESGKIKILPERFEKIYYHWIDNLRDWCISRQIWYGHRIPVWYCTRGNRGEGTGARECAVPIVRIEEMVTCPQCGGDVEQDPDTLDTWFSSGLWTFSTLGWPDETDDLKTYHPTSVLETGYDILFFWVARMILMTTYLLDDIPFKTVYLHGLVRDEKGRKMSKSIGNVIDPLDMIGKYGADATRLSLVIGAAPGTDIKLSEDRVRGYRNFGTKIWNVARFVLMHTPEGYDPASARRGETDDDRRRLAELDAVKNEVAAHYEAFQFHLAGEKAYHYFWHT